MTPPALQQVVAGVCLLRRDSTQLKTTLLVGVEDVTGLVSADVERATELPTDLSRFEFVIFNSELSERSLGQLMLLKERISQGCLVAVRLSIAPRRLGLWRKLIDLVSESPISISAVSIELQGSSTSALITFFKAGSDDAVFPAVECPAFSTQDDLCRRMGTALARLKRPEVRARERSQRITRDVLMWPAIANAWIEAAQDCRPVEKLGNHATVLPLDTDDAKDPLVLDWSSRAIIAQQSSALEGCLVQVFSTRLNRASVALQLERGIAGSVFDLKFDSPDARVEALACMPVLVEASGVINAAATEIAAVRELMSQLNLLIGRQAPRLLAEGPDRVRAAGLIEQTSRVLRTTVDSFGDGLEHRVQRALQFLPTPLARILMSWSETVEPRDQLKLLLLFFEASACLHATVAMSAFFRIPSHQQLGAKQGETPRFRRASFGSWHAVLEFYAAQLLEVAGKPAHPDTTKISEAFGGARLAGWPSLMFDKRAHELVTEAMDIRNTADGHGGFLPGSVVPKTVARLQAMLSQYLELIEGVWSSLRLYRSFGVRMTPQGMRQDAIEMSRSFPSATPRVLELHAPVVDGQLFVLAREAESRAVQLLPLVRICSPNDAPPEFGFYSRLEDGDLTYTYCHRTGEPPAPVAWSSLEASVDRDLLTQLRPWIFG